MNLDPLEIVIYIINLIVLFVILRSLLYKPVHKFMAGRTQRISSQLDEAAKKETDAQKTKEQYDSLIADSEKAANEKLSEIIRKANADAGEIVEKANEKAKVILDGARTEAEAEKKNILNNMRSEITDLSLNIAGKILSREVTESDNKKIIDSFFDGKE